MSLEKTLSKQGMTPVSLQRWIACHQLRLSQRYAKSEPSKSSPMGAGLGTTYFESTMKTVVGRNLCHQRVA